MSDTGKLPSGWAATSISEITNSIGGGTPSTTDPTFWEGGATPWVSPKDMKVFRLRHAIDSVTERALERLTVVPPSSVLVVVRSGILAHSLPVAINERSVVLNQDMRAFVPQPGVNAAFVAWQLVAYGGEILERCTKDGTTVASIEASRLASFELKLAPAPEQFRVVDAIESLLSALDVAIRDLETAKRKLSLYRESLLKSAVEGTFTARWRSRRGSRTSIKGPLPAGWTWMPLSHCCRVVSGYAFPSRCFMDSGIPVAKIANVGHGCFVDGTGMDHVEASFGSSHGDFLVEPGDILIALTRPITNDRLKSCRYPEGRPRALLNQRVAALRPLDPDLASYLFHVTCSPYFRECMAAAATQTLQPNVSPNALRGFLVPIPPREEAVVISDGIVQALSSVAAVEADVDQAVAACTAQRQNILRAAFSGQLVPQDPNDEPASVLLERIRAHKAAAPSAGRVRVRGRAVKGHA